MPASVTNHRRAKEFGIALNEGGNEYHRGDLEQ